MTLSVLIPPFTTLLAGIVKLDEVYEFPKEFCRKRFNKGTVIFINKIVLVLLAIKVVVGCTILVGLRETKLDGHREGIRGRSDNTEVGINLLLLVGEMVIIGF